MCGRSAASSMSSCAMPAATRSRRGCRCRPTPPATTARRPPPGACSSRPNGSRVPCPTRCPAPATTTPSSRRPSRCRRCNRRRGWCSSRRTSTFESRRPWSACTPRTTSAIAPSRMPMSSTRDTRRSRRISGTATAKTCAPGKKARARSTRSRGPRSRSGRPTSSCTRTAKTASRRWCAACRATRRPWNWSAISAANATVSGASARATASRTTRSTC